VKNEELLHVDKRGKNILSTTKRRKAKSHCVGTAFYNTILKEKYKGREENEEGVSN
jgi:hypothetical protein